MGINYQELYENAPNYEQRRGVNGYHYTSRIGVIDYTKGAKTSDIAQLKSVDRGNLMTMECGDTESRFGIGFEIEKSRFHRNAVTRTALVAGYERDSSCGFEAVTNILPLLPAGDWRNKVYSMMYDSRYAIEDKYSPSNYKCGGHVTLSCKGMTGEDLYVALRKHMGIVYALFRKRLNNYYCSQSGNVELNPDFNGGRYVPMLMKRNVVEIRLVSRFQSVKQMMRRYELFYVMMDYAVNKPNASKSAFINKVKPIIKAMYDGDTDKVSEICSLAKSFNKYLSIGLINREVIEFIDPMRRMVAESSYDQDLLRNGFRSI